MGHGQASTNHFIFQNVNNATGASPIISPALRRISFGDGGNETWHSILYRKPVQVAAVLRREPRDELGLPDRSKAVLLVELSKA